jgi:hypothetical protein
VLHRLRSSSPLAAPIRMKLALHTVHAIPSTSPPLRFPAAAFRRSAAAYFPPANHHCRYRPCTDLDLISRTLRRFAPNLRHILYTPSAAFADTFAATSAAAIANTPPLSCIRAAITFAITSAEYKTIPVTTQNTTVEFPSNMCYQLSPLHQPRVIKAAYPLI